MALHHNPRIVTSGLVLALDAADINSYPGSGTTWYDVSGNGNHGTIYGSTAYSAGAFDLGSVNHATNYILVPDQVMVGIDSFAVGFWVNPSSIQSLNCIWHATVGGGNDFSIEWYPTYIQTLMTATYSTFSWTRTDGNWYNLVFTRSGASMNFYLNGALFGTQTCPTTTFNITGAIVLGQEQDAIQGGFDAAQSYKGKYASTSFYNRTLTASEILQNYLAQKSRFGL